MEEDKDMSYEEGMSEKVKTWIQENLRVITSVFIVAVIAFGIYSYSDRTVPSENADLKKIESSETAKEETSGDTVSEETQPQKEVQPTEASQETEGSFIETAGRGDGLTHLARRAAADYLEKNADSSVTVEHRVYIEDYLRKKVGHTGGVKMGTSVEFSKDLIREAVDASKRLNDRQLENLKRYSARVSEFRK
ncbi:MAG: hypothetical protein HGB18_04310 [Candidatus Moranbacteria bacterium]|nr:hypothetical protein [Candidatus Moranbacteria bacterium]